MFGAVGVARLAIRHTSVAVGLQRLHLRSLPPSWTDWAVPTF